MQEAQSEARLRAVQLLRDYQYNLGRREQMMRDLVRMNLVEAELIREERSGEGISGLSLKGSPITDMPRAGGITSKVERIVMSNIGAQRMAQEERTQIMDELSVVNYQIGQAESMLMALSEEERLLIELHYIMGLPLSQVERKWNEKEASPYSRKWIVRRIKQALDKCEGVIWVSVPYIFSKKFCVPKLT